MKEASDLLALAWEGDLQGHCLLLDQTALPAEERVLRIETVEEMWDAIRRLAVRGAPAIGVATAFGMVLAARASEAKTTAELFEDLRRAAAYLATSRPTARNLGWALEQVLARAQVGLPGNLQAMRQAVLEHALELWEDDRRICRELARVGSALVGDGEGILTHCNTGALATAGSGTALALVFAAQAQGKRVTVWAGETRPLLQGARLTTWELRRAGIETTLICDSAAAQVMKEGRVHRVLVGADRIARNGDTANKIGTYSLAVLAQAHDLPFHVVAPVSTFDLALASGAQIPIEERPASEVTEGFGRPTAPSGTKVYSPAFDVTPAHLITSIVTERGIVSPVDEETVVSLVGP